ARAFQVFLGLLRRRGIRGPSRDGTERERDGEERRTPAGRARRNDEGRRIHGTHDVTRSRGRTLRRENTRDQRENRPARRPRRRRATKPRRSAAESAEAPRARPSLSPLPLGPPTRHPHPESSLLGAAAAAVPPLPESASSAPALPPFPVAPAVAPVPM